MGASVRDPWLTNGLALQFNEDRIEIDRSIRMTVSCASVVRVAVSALEIDWDRRLVDAGLPFGFVVLQIPLRGGSMPVWRELVTELQGASSVDASGPGGFHLVAARRTGELAQLDIGLHVGGDAAALFEGRLRAAVERVNRGAGLASPVVRAARPLPIGARRA